MLKLKSQYKNKITQFRRGIFIDVYPNVRSCVCKKFSTKQEKSLYILHLIEFRKYPVNIRAKRGSALADYYDDYPTYVYKIAKSWKHNSKRYHQYS